MYFIDTEKVENESVESGDKKRGTILIVEDNNEIRRYLSNGLADLFNTLEAGNGEEALEKLKDKRSGCDYHRRHDAGYGWYQAMQERETKYPDLPYSGYYSFRKDRYQRSDGRSANGCG